MTFEEFVDRYLDAEMPAWQRDLALQVARGERVCFTGLGLGRVRRVLDEDLLRLWALATGTRVAVVSSSGVRHYGPAATTQRRSPDGCVAARSSGRRLRSD